MKKRFLIIATLLFALIAVPTIVEYNVNESFRLELSESKANPNDPPLNDEVIYSIYVTCEACGHEEHWLNNQGLPEWTICGGCGMKLEFFTTTEYWETSDGLYIVWKVVGQ